MQFVEVFFHVLRQKLLSFIKRFLSIVFNLLVQETTFSHLEIPKLFIWPEPRVFRKMLCFLATKTLGSPVRKKCCQVAFLLPLSLMFNNHSKLTGSGKSFLNRAVTLFLVSLQYVIFAESSNAFSICFFVWGFIVLSSTEGIWGFFTFFKGWFVCFLGVLCVCISGLVFFGGGELFVSVFEV